MTAVGLGQRVSQAEQYFRGLSDCRAKYFYDLSVTFFDARNYWNTEGFPYEILGTVRQKIFDGNSWYSPPLLSINFFATEKFLKHSTEGFAYEIFRHCQTKKFRPKLVT